MNTAENLHSKSDWIARFNIPSFLQGPENQEPVSSAQEEDSEGFTREVPNDKNIYKMLANWKPDEFWKYIDAADSTESLWPSSGQFPNIITRILSAQNLNDALGDLREVGIEAREEGFPPPSETTIEIATRLLHEMYRILPRRYEIYPMQDGEIAIDAPGGHGRSVILLCEATGGALCLVNMGDRHRRARYSHVGDLPDNFLRDALHELSHRDEQAA